MPDIAITAAITDGAALLFEEPATGRLRLPRLPFTHEHEEIEQALADHLRERMGVEIIDQQFVDTVFERQNDGGVTVNNLQVITAWSGDVPDRDVVGIALHWIPFSELPRIEMSDDLRAVLLAALGLQDEAELNAQDADASQAPGRVIVLSGGDDDAIRLVAQNIPAALGRCALVEIAAIRGLVRPGPNDVAGAAGFAALMRRMRLLSLRNAATIAFNTSAAGIDTLLYGTFAETAELDALLAALLGTELYLVHLTREGWRADPRGMAIGLAPGGAAETAGRIIAQLDAARVA
jgi:hypothetical protein